MGQNMEYDKNICDEEVWTWLQIKQNNLQYLQWMLK